MCNHKFKKGNICNIKKCTDGFCKNHQPKKTETNIECEIVEEEFEEKVEKWKVVEDFSNYEISDFGNCRNKETKRHLKPSINKGYQYTTIKNDDGDKKFVSIHRLVALAFIPNPEKKETVNHKSHNTLDNRVEKLELMTMKEQSNHQKMF